jgi:hypothetical protein
LRNLKCDQFNITKPCVGESFKNFKVEKGDLYIGDRAYGRLKGLNYIKQEGGDFIVRMKNKAFSISRNGKEFKLLEECEKLQYGEHAEFKIRGYSNEGIEMDLRLCVIKKSKTQGEAAIKKAKRGASKGRRKIEGETLELQRYIIVLSSLPDTISVEEILDAYRYRWQIEIAFKRLKSILGLGFLPKTDEESCKAWLNGKIFVSMLAQAIVDEGQHFSPWGYPTK